MACDRSLMVTHMAISFMSHIIVPIATALLHEMQRWKTSCEKRVATAAFPDFLQASGLSSDATENGNGESRGAQRGGGDSQVNIPACLGIGLKLTWVTYEQLLR